MRGTASPHPVAVQKDKPGQAGTRQSGGTGPPGDRTSGPAHRNHAQWL